MGPSPAPAKKPLDAEVTADAAAQLYELRSPTGQTVISRRRLTSTIGVSAYDLMDKPANPMGPTLTFRARLRYDADYGGSVDETTPSKLDHLVPGLDRGPGDLMYGYIEGRRFFNGALNFKLGRQYVTDALGWWSFDGGEAMVTTPYYFAVEAYGGLEQRGGLPFSTPRYEQNGVWRGDRTDYDPSTYPSFQPNEIAPAFGVAVETAGFTWLHGRLTYRRVYNTGTSNTSAFANGVSTPISYDGSRISQERLGYSVDATLAKYGGFKAGFNYDLYSVKMANIYASLDWYTTQNLTVSLDYDYYQPTFDGDSIWNFFMGMPMNDLGLRAAWDPSTHVSLAGGAHVPRLHAADRSPSPASATSPPNQGLQAANYYPSSSLEPEGGANVSARYHFGEGSLGARGTADLANNGDRVGLDVYGERTLETRYVFQGRLGVWEWDDKLRADRQATDFSYSLATGYKLWPRSMVLADFQHDMNRIAGQRFRAMLYLTIALSTSGRGL